MPGSMNRFARHLPTPGCARWTAGGGCPHMSFAGFEDSASSNYHQFMPVETEVFKGPTSIRAPRGNQITCKGWQQEAAMRMLMNNLDSEVAERPQDLVVYGGTGRAARSWKAYRAIVESLKNLENEETVVVQSGRPGSSCVRHDAG